MDTKHKNERPADLFFFCIQKNNNNKTFLVGWACFVLDLIHGGEIYLPPRSGGCFFLQVADPKISTLLNWGDCTSWRQHCTHWGKLHVRWNPTGIMEGEAEFMYSVTRGPHERENQKNCYSPNLLFHFNSAEESLLFISVIYDHISVSLLCLWTFSQTFGPDKNLFYCKCDKSFPTSVTVNITRESEEKLTEKLLWTEVSVTSARFNTVSN